MRSGNNNRAFVVNNDCVVSNGMDFSSLPPRSVSERLEDLEVVAKVASNNAAVISEVKSNTAPAKMESGGGAEEQKGKFSRESNPLKSRAKNHVVKKSIF